MKKKLTKVSDGVTALFGNKESAAAPSQPTIPQLTYVPQPQPKPTQINVASVNASLEKPKTGSFLKKSPSMPDLGEKALISAVGQEVKQPSVSSRNPSASSYVVEQENGTFLVKNFKSESGIEKHKTVESLDIGLDALTSVIHLEEPNKLPKDIDFTKDEAVVVYIKKPNMARPKLPSTFIKNDDEGKSIYDKPLEGMQPVKVQSKSGKHFWHLAKFVPWAEDPYKVLANVKDPMPLDPYTKLQEEKKLKALEFKANEPAVEAQVTPTGNSETVVVATPEQKPVEAQPQTAVAKEIQAPKIETPAEENVSTENINTPEETPRPPVKKIKVSPKPAPKSLLARLWDKVKSFATWVFSGFKAVFHTIFWFTKPKATKLEKPLLAKAKVRK